MAYGWGKSSGTPGVVLAITGPGLTNILTPLGQAFHDSVPMVAVTTQIPSRFLSGRSGYLHELRDSTVMSSSVAKGSFRASSPEEIPLLVERALRLPVEGRPGPVHVEIPLTISTKPCGLPAGEPVRERDNPLPEGLARRKLPGACQQPVALHHRRRRRRGSGRSGEAPRREALRSRGADLGGKRESSRTTNPPLPRCAAPFSRGEGAAAEFRTVSSPLEPSFLPRTCGKRSFLFPDGMISWTRDEVSPRPGRACSSGAGARRWSPCLRER